MFKLQIENILKDFYNNQHIFSEEDFLYFGDTLEDKDILSKSFKEDSRFIKILKKDTTEKYFLSKKTLFNTFCKISLKLAAQKVFSLDQNHLKYLFEPLCRKGRIDYPTDDFVAFGKNLGFVEEHVSHNDRYIFPIAYLLSFMTERKSALAINLIEEKVSSTQEIDAINFLVISNDFLNEGLSRLRERESFIIKAREGFPNVEKKTLEEIGNIKGITKERVRQIEKKAWARIKHPNNSTTLLAAFVSFILNNQGQLLYHDNIFKSHTIRFLAKCSYIPVSNFLKLGIFLLGNKAVDIDLSQLQIINYFEHQQCVSYLTAKDNVIMKIKDFHEFAKCLSMYSKKKLNKGQKVYIALKKIGRPAHYSQIADMYNSLFPDSPSTERNIHAILSREVCGIVWIGVRGTFALKEWGYEHPDLTLFETVTKIVRTIYKETKRPVHFNIIIFEIGKYRKIVNRNSIIIAAYCNPGLQRIGKNSFIPKEKTEIINGEEEEKFENILDRVLREMENLAPGTSIVEPPKEETPVNFPIPHTLDEDFSSMKPYGFLLEGISYKELKTWGSLYLKVFEVLKKVNIEKIDILKSI